MSSFAYAPLSIEENGEVPLSLKPRRPSLRERIQGTPRWILVTLGVGCTALFLALVYFYSAGSSILVRKPPFCNVCGPDDVYCEKYGPSILARSRAYEGTASRYQRLLRDAQAGKPIKIGILGGSVSRGHGVQKPEIWVNVFADWWRTQFPTGTLVVQNGAIPATGTNYMSMCWNEHIDDDADLIFTEFAINDLRDERNAHTYELLLRQLLELPKKPPVINMQTFGWEAETMSTGADLHTPVAMYYDVPVISLRNALMPQLLAAPEIRPTYHAKTWDGKTDFRHINNRGHQMFADMLIAFTQRQLCALSNPTRPTGSAEPATLLTSQDPTLDAVPAHALFSSPLHDAPALHLHPYCASTRTKHHPLIPSFNDGKWSNWTFNGGEHDKTYVRATEPGAKVAFKFPMAEGGMGRVRFQWLRSKSFGMGIARCWLDEDEDKALLFDGFWDNNANLAATEPISNNTKPGEHTLWCELTADSHSENKGTEFRIIGLDSS